MRKLIATLAVIGIAAAAVVGWVVAGGTAATSQASHHENGSKAPKIAEDLARARLATAKYANDLEAAKADGYTMLITPMMPDMGYHFMNPDITGFDVTKPPILVYVRYGEDWQLVAFEWVFPEKPATKPLPGAAYGSFGAACHFEDGNFIFEDIEGDCPSSNEESGAAFAFWHPELVTLHLWAWYPNPQGIFNGTNSLVSPFNEATSTGRR